MEKEIKSLNQKQDSQTWKRFYAALVKSAIRQYRVVYKSGKLKNKQDLYSSYVELFDSRGRLVGSIPLFEKDGKRLRGATKYLVSLSNINKFR